MKKVTNMMCCKASCEEVKDLLKECCLPGLHGKTKKNKLCKVRSKQLFAYDVVSCLSFTC